MKIITQIRKYYPTFTESELYIEGITKPIWVLEDVGRPVGVKFDGATCLPEVVSKVSISRSTRFKKDMLLLSNQDDGSIEKYGVRFTGVRPHGGNTTEDTEGCPLCAYNTDHNGKVWERASDDIFNIVKGWLAKGEEVRWVITS